MTCKSETSSVRVATAAIALSVLGLTTTLNSGNIRYDIAPPLAAMKNVSENDMGTMTIFPRTVERKVNSRIDSAWQLFDGNMREFTKEETEKYEESLKKIYKPIGVNIFDIC